MTCLIYVANTDYRGADALYIEPERAQSDAEILLTVNKHLEKVRWGRRCTARDYEAQYLHTLRYRYSQVPEQFLALLERPRIVLVCTCGSRKVCHAPLAAQALLRIGEARGVAVRLEARLEERMLF